MNMKAVLSAATVALALPLAAEAATITEGFNFTLQQSVLTSPGQSSVSFETGGKTWDISTISFTANGVYSNIQKVTVTFSNTGESYSAWEPGVNGFTATLQAAGFVTSDDFLITYTYAAGGTGTVLTNASFFATEVPDVPAVPVPAAGILLVSALAGLGIAKRRAKKA